MNRNGDEIEWLKASVSCAALLERLAPVWRLDRAESTRRGLKYRRGAGEILIVSHGGRGWWEPRTDDAVRAPTARRPAAARERPSAARYARPCPGRPGCGAGGVFSNP
jgi:hypothetical protein